jgi:hypothetical protein
MATPKRPDPTPAYLDEVSDGSYSTGLRLLLGVLVGFCIIVAVIFYIASRMPV